MGKDALEAALQSCTLHPLLMITSKILTRAGFGDVEIMDRRLSQQKSRYGGHEIVCSARIGDKPAKVIVKVIQDKVRLRMLDEICGAVDRTNADFGLLVSPFPMSLHIASYLPLYNRSRIEALDGPQLAELSRRHRVGIRGVSDVDYAFFGELERVSQHLLDFMGKEGHGC